jgi:PKD repeat protein
MAFQLSAATGETISSANWSFGDNTAVQSGTGSVTHTYVATGAYEISVTAVDTTGANLTATYLTNVIVYPDGYTCATQTTITAPTTATVGVPVNVSANIPSCLTSQITSVTWSFGDSSP